MTARNLLASIGILALATAAQAQTSFTGSYTQNFDGLGTAGTAAPTGWSVYSMAGSHDTFAPTDSPTAGVLPNMTAGTLTARTTLTVAPSTSGSFSSSSSGLNIGSSRTATDRALGTAPTGIAGMILQLSLTNNSGIALDAINLSFDIRRFTTTTNNNSSYDSSIYKGVEEYPGYRLFFSLNSGSSWTNVSALNPTLSGMSGVVVPNTVGVTNVPTTLVSLGGNWNTGSTLLLRWLDDNAQSPSPDQVLGLDNITVAIPEPSCVAALFACGTLGLVSLRRRIRR